MRADSPHSNSNYLSLDEGHRWQVEMWPGDQLKKVCACVAEAIFIIFFPERLT